MLVIQKRCKICTKVKADKKLLKRIYESKYFVPHSKDTLFQLAEDEGLAYRGLLTHVKKHQFIDQADYTEAMLKQADKKAELSAVAKAVKGQSAIQSIIDKGAERLQNEEITVNTDQLIRASQIQIASDEKKKDQDLMALSLAHFMSGESTSGRTFIDAEEPDELPE